MPIGLCTVRPAFGKMHTMFQKTRVQGVPLAPLEDRHARAGDGACCIHKKVVAADQMSPGHRKEDNTVRRTTLLLLELMAAALLLASGWLWPKTL